MFKTGAVGNTTLLSDLHGPGSDGSPCSFWNNRPTGFAVHSGTYRSANVEANCGWTLPNGEVENEFTWLTRASFKNSWLLSLQVSVQPGQFVHAGKGGDLTSVSCLKPCQVMKWFSRSEVCLLRQCFVAILRRFAENGLDNQVIKLLNSRER